MKSIYRNERTNETMAQTMESLMAVNEKSEGIIGKFFYYSTSNLLIYKEKFQEIGMAFGLPKYRPARESKAGVYRTATTALKDRVTVKDGSGTNTYRIYCRDNKKRGCNAYLSRTCQRNFGCQNEFVSEVS